MFDIFHILKTAGLSLAWFYLRIGQKGLARSKLLEGYISTLLPELFRESESLEVTKEPHDVNSSCEAYP